MTALPLVWGEGEIADTLARTREPARAYRWLSERYDVTLLDTLDAATLRRAPLLLLAQPRGLAPAELTALDEWVRRGGRALILADADLDWHGALPPGDPRAPPPMTLLDPLLTHWGLRLDLPERFVKLGGDCAVEGRGLVALCPLGAGKAVLVADADLLHDDLWDARRGDFASWLERAER